MAWKITPSGGTSRNLAKSSEVEVRFTPEPDGSTRVNLEHRDILNVTARTGRSGKQVDSQGGWGDCSSLYAPRLSRDAELTIDRLGSGPDGEARRIAHHDASGRRKCFPGLAISSAWIPKPERPNISFAGSGVSHIT